MCRMTDINVRALSEDEWEQFRSIRLAALEDSPDAFVATADAEREFEEPYWRLRMNRARRLVAEVEDTSVGVVSLGKLEGADGTAELFGLWVSPDWRGRSVAATLVTQGAQQALDEGYQRLAYWVGTDNGRAVAFASSFGFRPTGRRRPMRVRNGDGETDEEIAMVLSLAGDRGASW